MDGLYDDVIGDDTSGPVVESGGAGNVDGGTADSALAAERVSILERNISCLFATARLEIKRKDGEIDRLRAM